MRALSLALILLGSCAVVDTLDGHIDEIEHCCAAGTQSRVRRCMAKFQDSVADHCWAAKCSPPIGYVEAFLDADGEIRDECPPEVPPPPF